MKLTCHLLKALKITSKRRLPCEVCIRRMSSSSLPLLQFGAIPHGSVKWLATPGNEIVALTKKDIRMDKYLRVSCIYYWDDDVIEWLNFNLDDVLEEQARWRASLIS